MRFFDKSVRFRRGLPHLQWHTSPGVLISRSCADCYKHMCSELRDEGERKGFEAAQKEFTHVESLHQASRQSPSEKIPCFLRHSLTISFIYPWLHPSCSALFNRCLIRAFVAWCPSGRTHRSRHSFIHSLTQPFLHSFLYSGGYSYQLKLRFRAVPLHELLRDAPASQTMLRCGVSFATNRTTHRLGGEICDIERPTILDGLASGGYSYRPKLTINTNGKYMFLAKGTSNPEGMLRFGV